MTVFSRAIYVPSVNQQASWQEDKDVAQGATLVGLGVGRDLKSKVWARLGTSLAAP